MHIDLQTKKNKRENNHTLHLRRREKKVREFFISEKKEIAERENKLLESPEDMLISEHSEDVLSHWQGPEYEVYEKDSRWYMIATLIITAIVAYAVITNSPIMAITFILIGVVGYIQIQKPPRVLNFIITRDGVSAGRELYAYENIKSFWIEYSPPHTKILSLHLKGAMIPYVHIPVHQEDPVKIREALIEFIPEVEQEPSLIDALERLLHI